MRKYQKGHATLLAAIIIPALFGVFVLATDGAMALQQKARMDDAHEVAALALSAQDSKSSDKNKKIAKAYITEYMGDSSKIADVRIKRLECEQIPECKAGLALGEQRYVRYGVSAKYDHSTFFPNSDVAPETLTISSNATSEKFEGDAVDIMYVADFSGSMNNKMGYKTRVQVLKEIVHEVNQRLEKFNNSGNKKYKNTVGMVPFSVATLSKPTGVSRNCNLNQIVRKSKNFSWKRLDEKHIDFKATAAQVMKEKGPDNCMDRNYWIKNAEIDSTQEFSSFISKVRRYTARQGTASYQGVIRAAQLLKKGENPRRLIIVLADGRDSNIANISNKYVHEKLVGLGYCDTIRQELSKGKTKDGRPIRAKIAVIGFAFKASSSFALRQCAGAENVYDANNKEEIKAKILDLITEEIGHLK